jgi:peptide/nickel transport system substrate-binding protein
VPRLAIVRRPADAMQYVGWNLRDPRFAEQRVREALALAIDKDGLLKQLFTAGGEVYAQPCIGTVSPAQGALVPADVDPIPYDADEARKRLAGKDLKFTLMIQTGSSETKRLAVWLQAAWAKVGVTVAIEAVEPNRFSDRARTHDFEAVLWGFGAGSAIDPSIQWRSDGQYNWFGYADPATDALIDEGLRTTDAAAAAEAFREVQRRVHEAQPALFLAWNDALVAVDRRFRDVAISRASLLLHAERWWVPAAEQRY